MFKSFSMDLAGRKLTVEVGRVAAQANGAAFTQGTPCLVFYVPGHWIQSHPVSFQKSPSFFCSSTLMA